MSWINSTRPPPSYTPPLAPEITKQTSDTDAVKRCARCGAHFPMAHFSPRKASKDGLQTYCKPCMNLSSRECRARQAQRLAARPPKGAGHALTA